MFLGLRGYVTFDYPWLFGPGQIAIVDAATALGIDLGAKDWSRKPSRSASTPTRPGRRCSWTVSRIALHTGVLDVTEITNDHIVEALQAIRLFAELRDLEWFYPSPQNYRDNAAKKWITHLHQLQVVLFHRGQIAKQPRKLMPSWKPPLVLPPTNAGRRGQVAGRPAADRRAGDGGEAGARGPQVRRLARRTPPRDRLLRRRHPRPLPGLGPVTRRGTDRADRQAARRRLPHPAHLRAGQLFRDTAAWQWDDVPGHSLISPRDAPKPPTADSPLHPRRRA